MVHEVCGKDNQYHQYQKTDKNQNRPHPDLAGGKDTATHCSFGSEGN